MQKSLKKENAITLIALVITIIVLLILAGVSIAMLTGENGILTQANQAKNEMNNKTIEEKIQIAVTGAKTIDKGYIELNFNNLTQELENQFGKDKVTVSENQDSSFEVALKESNKEYNVTKTGEIKQGLNWEEIMQNVMPPADQTNKNVIGIGTNGQTVNMDFWKFGYDVVTNGYGLNSKEVLQNTEYNKNGTNTETIRTAGYIGPEKEKIIIPQYISEDNGKTYKPVTSLYRTFLNNTNIVSTPDIPMTVNNMFCAFEGCSNLREYNIPTSVNNIKYAFAATAIEKVEGFHNNLVEINGAFAKCYSLIKVTGNIPSTVTNMNATFSECTNLKEADITLPEGLKSMYQTFYRCENLEKGPNVIPSTVDDMTQTFQKCLKLHGIITVKATPSKCDNSFGENCGSTGPEKLVLREWNGNRAAIEKIIERSWNSHIVGEWQL